MATQANQKPAHAGAATQNKGQAAHSNGDGAKATEATTAVQTAAAEGGQAAAEAEARKRAPAANFLAIVRGRLPMIFVHAVRFDPVVSKMAKKDAATKFATSVGKIFDIQKGRNFAYVTEGFKPTADDVAAAEAWIAQTGQANAKGQTAIGDKDLMTKVLEQYKARGLATAEDAAKFAAERSSSRPAKAPAPAAGAQGAATQQTAAQQGAALLS